MCNEDWINRIVVRNSTNISESNHTVCWSYAPKNLTNSIYCFKTKVLAAAIFGAIHLNEGQHAVGKFIEELGYPILLLHDFFRC